MDFAFWWSFIEKGLGLQPAQMACFFYWIGVKFSFFAVTNKGGLLSLFIGGPKNFFGERGPFLCCWSKTKIKLLMASQVFFFFGQSTFLERVPKNGGG